MQISQPSPYVVRVGQRVSFECTASDPSSNVYWEYPDRRLPSTSAVDARVWVLRCNRLVDIFEVSTNEFLDTTLLLMLLIAGPCRSSLLLHFERVSQNPLSAGGFPYLCY